MSYERLTASDTVFLRIETDHEPQHVGSLSIVEGAPLRDDAGRIRFPELRDHIERRSLRVPRLRQKLMEVPLGQGRPVWIDDHSFDIDYHVRLTSLPRPGDENQLATLMSRLQSLALDRRRPLWEMWIVDGLENDDVGLIIKTHHALGDGIANVDLALALVDLEPDPGPDAEAHDWTPRPAPSRNRLLFDSVWDQVNRPGRLVRSSIESVLDPKPLVRSAGNVVRTATSFLSKPPKAHWNVDVSPHRRWVHAEVPFEALRAVREAHEATINDIVLAACTGALRDFLGEHQAEVRGRRLTAMVPVSVRSDDEHGDTLGNRISMIVVDLPVDEADPIRRLELVRHQSSERRGSGAVDGAATILELADAMTPLAAPLTRFISRQIPMNLVITNIPGPPVPLYLRGGLIRRTYPYVEVIDGEGLTIAVVSYDDRLFFGITADRDVLPDLDRVARGIEAHVADLAAAGERSAR